MLINLRILGGRNSFQKNLYNNETFQEEEEEKNQLPYEKLKHRHTALGR